jgi:hypothetical protein
MLEGEGDAFGFISNAKYQCQVRRMQMRVTPLSRIHEKYDQGGCFLTQQRTWVSKTSNRTKTRATGTKAPKVHKRPEAPHNE